MRTPIPIADGVYVLRTELVNWYLLEEDGRPTAVEAVVLTHSDWDHTGVARVLRDAGARVLIHSAEEEGLREPRLKTGNTGAALMLT